MIPKGTYRRKLLAGIQPYHILLKELYDAKGWHKYSIKQKRLHYDDVRTEDGDLLDSPIDHEQPIKVPTYNLFKRISQ